MSSAMIKIITETTFAGHSFSRYVFMFLKKKTKILSQLPIFENKILIARNYYR